MNCKASLPHLKSGGKKARLQLFERALQSQGYIGLDLYEAGLGEQIEAFVKELYAGKGSVRSVLHRYTTAR